MKIVLSYAFLTVLALQTLCIGMESSTLSCRDCGVLAYCGILACKDCGILACKDCGGK